MPESEIWVWEGQSQTLTEFYDVWYVVEALSIFPLYNLYY